MKQFIVVWLRIAGDQDNILTLKLWVNFLQKVSLLKAVKNQLSPFLSNFISRRNKSFGCRGFS